MRGRRGVSELENPEKGLKLQREKSPFTKRAVSELENPEKGLKLGDLLGRGEITEGLRTRKPREGIETT